MWSLEEDPKHYRITMALLTMLLQEVALLTQMGSRTVVKSLLRRRTLKSLLNQQYTFEIRWISHQFGQEH